MVWRSRASSGRWVEYHARVIRLRQSLEAGLRHPLLGPVLVLSLAFVLAFVILHAVEHGVEGLLFTCAVVAAVFLRLVVVVGRMSLARRGSGTTTLRGPPPRATGREPALRSPPTLAALPLRL
jgi:hypothetical protein